MSSYEHSGYGIVASRFPALLGSANSVKPYNHNIASDGIHSSWVTFPYIGNQFNNHITPGLDAETRVRNGLHPLSYNYSTSLGTCGNTATILNTTLQPLQNFVLLNSSTTASERNMTLATPTSYLGTNDSFRHLSRPFFLNTPPLRKNNGLLPLMGHDGNGNTDANQHSLHWQPAAIFYEAGFYPLLRNHNP